MLERLIDYASRRGLDAEPGFAAKNVKWAIACDANGIFTGVQRLGDEGRGRSFPKVPHLSQPELVGGSVPRSHYLVEYLSTVAQWLKTDADQKARERARAKHEFFRELLAASDDVEPGLTAAARMLGDSEQLTRIHVELERQKAKETDLATIYLNGRLLVASDTWHDWWRGYRAQLGGAAPSAEGPRVRCLVTGQFVDPASTHPKIKGLAGVGGIGMGDVMVGFDKDAFRSYGMEQSANAAMSEQAASAYAAALNDLISNHSAKLAGALAVHWFTERVEESDDLLAGLLDPAGDEPAAQSKARELLNAIRTGKRPDLAGNRYYALLLSGAAGRVMVRDWMEGSFEELAANIDAWFTDLDIVGRDGGRVRQPKFLAVAGSLVRDLGDLPAPLLRGLWHAALTCGAIPYAALSRAVQRARIDVITNNSPSPSRIGLIKAFHLRKGDGLMDRTVNPGHPSAAYHCGRLLAVLANLQHAALGDVGAGVVQRYYTAASQTPALVIGRLIANAKNHLNKLEPGLAYWFEERIAEVMTRMGDAAPSTLTLEQQSLFALGYYQQLAELRTKKVNPAAESVNSTN